MSKKKTRINLKRFIPFCIICALLLYGIGYGVGKLLAKIKNKQDDPKPPVTACEHEYQKGVCTKCGEADPDYVPDERDSWPNTSTTADMYPLSKSDDDMLVLVNKTHTVTADYIPGDLVDVKYYDPNVGNASRGTRSVRSVVAKAFEELHDAAAEQGYDIVLRNGYRSYDYQTDLYNSYVNNHGQEEADKFSARPGTSEHQTGWAIDVGIPGIYIDYFTGTDEAKWVKENCYKYGFILRFIDGTETTVGPITGYIAESWHIRYVGLDAAKIIYERGWTLEEYLQELESLQN